MSKTTTQCIYWGEKIHLQSTNRTSPVVWILFHKVSFSLPPTGLFKMIFVGRLGLPPSDDDASLTITLR